MKKSIHISMTDELWHVGFKLPMPMVDYFDKIASRELRTRADIIRSALVEWIADREAVTTGKDAEAAK